MSTYHIAGTEHGPMLVIDEGVQADGVEHIREIPLQAIASFSEMLGYADPAEALEAIIAEQDQRDEDSPVRDPFAEVQELLTHREREREEAARVVRDHESHTSYQVEVAATQMAYRAVHEPVDGGDCVMDRCRGEARGRLNVTAPTSNADATTRVARSATSRTDELAQVVSQCADMIEAERKGFLHMLTGNLDDPLSEPDSDHAKPADPLAEIFAKYQGGQQWT